MNLEPATLPMNRIHIPSGAPLRLTVVVAAFNEAQALPLLHPRIQAALALVDGLQGRVV